MAEWNQFSTLFYQNCGKYVQQMENFVVFEKDVERKAKRSTTRGNRDDGEKRARASTGCWERGVTSFHVGSTVSLVTNLTHVESSARDRSVSLSTIVCPRSTGLSNSVRVIGERQSAGIR